MGDEHSEIQKQFRQQQEKYVYYVIALCVTAIGFSVYKTSGVALKLIQIPLALAVVAWGLSIFCGLRFLQYVISSLYANHIYFDIMEGRHPKAGTHPELIKAAATGITEAIEINSNRANRLAKWQNKFFYIGIISFIAWHVIEMYTITTHII